MRVRPPRPLCLSVGAVDSFNPSVPRALVIQRAAEFGKHCSVYQLASCDVRSSASLLSAPHTRQHDTPKVLKRAFEKRKRSQLVCHRHSGSCRCDTVKTVESVSWVGLAVSRPHLSAFPFSAGPRPMNTNVPTCTYRPLSPLWLVSARVPSCSHLQHPRGTSHPAVSRLLARPSLWVYDCARFEHPHPHDSRPPLSFPTNISIPAVAS